MALDPSGGLGLATYSSPKLKAGKDKCILLLKKNVFQLPILNLLVSGLFPANISQRTKSSTPDLPAPSVLVFQSSSANSLAVLLEIHVSHREEWCGLGSLTGMWGKVFGVTELQRRNCSVDL